MAKAPQNYYRNLPHLLRDDLPVFVTFNTKSRWVVPEDSRDLVLGSCLHDHGTKLIMYAAIVMPEHVHLLFRPLKDAYGSLH